MGARDCRRSRRARHTTSARPGASNGPQIARPVALSSANIRAPVKRSVRVWFAVSEARLILTCGLPGAGKTTLARQLSADRGAVRLTKSGRSAAGPLPVERAFERRYESAGVPRLESLTEVAIHPKVDRFPTRGRRGRRRARASSRARPGPDKLRLRRLRLQRPQRPPGCPR